MPGMCVKLAPKTGTYEKLIGALTWHEKMLETLIAAQQDATASIDELIKAIENLGEIVKDLNNTVERDIKAHS